VTEPSVLVVGEALVDIVIRPDGTEVAAPGGSPMNVAVTLARLGVSTQLATSLGDDEHGELIRTHLARSGAFLASGAHTLSKTSRAVARIQPDGSATYEFDITWAPDVPTLSSSSVVHAGSIALWLHPGAEAVRSCLEEAARLGALVTLDPNIRPAVLPDASSARRGFHELAQWADVVKLSVEDADYLYPGLSPADVVERVQASGVHVVALTDESRGTRIASGASCVVVRPPRVPVTDTIGAGDTYMGALIHQLLTRGHIEALKEARDLPSEELSTICSFANRAAAVTVSRQGADPPWLEELRPGRACTTA
jgi:fructokinase